MKTAKIQYEPIQSYEEALDPEQSQQEAPYVVAPVSEHDQEGYSESIDTYNGKASKPLMKDVYRIYNRLTPDHRYKVLQKWEGTVVGISDNECRAILRDLTSPELPQEEVTFSIEEISESDLELAVPGAVFYWSIGYYDHRDGQRFRTSTIRFRRFPVWRQKDLEKASEEATTIRDRLGWK